MRQFLFCVLNRHFRPIDPINLTLFPDHEFDKDEASRLMLFCETIQTKGYDWIFANRESKDVMDILDLAAEYGSFVSKDASPWYLGVFVAAEIVMQPYASESFYETLLRSEVFHYASSKWQNLILWLMLMAFFCDRPETAPRRLESFINDCNQKGFKLGELAIESFCDLRDPI